MVELCVNKLQYVFVDHFLLGTSLLVICSSYAAVLQRHCIRNHDILIDTDVVLARDVGCNSIRSMIASTDYKASQLVKHNTSYETS